MKFPTCLGQCSISAILIKPPRPIHSKPPLH